MQTMAGNLGVMEIVYLHPETLLVHDVTGSVSLVSDLT